MATRLIKILPVLALLFPASFTAFAGSLAPASSRPLPPHLSAAELAGMRAPKQVTEIPGDKTWLKHYKEHNQSDNANAINRADVPDPKKMEEFWGIIYRKHSDVLDPGRENLQETRKKKEYIGNFLSTELRAYEALKNNFDDIALDSKRSVHKRYSINITSPISLSELVDILSSLGLPVMFSNQASNVIIPPQTITHERARSLLNKVFAPHGVQVGYNSTSDKYMLYLIGSAK